jgi:hypothetical protein
VGFGREKQLHCALGGMEEEIADGMLFLNLPSTEGLEIVHPRPAVCIPLGLLGSRTVRLPWQHPPPYSWRYYICITTTSSPSSPYYSFRRNFPLAWFRTLLFDVLLYLPTHGCTRICAFSSGLQGPGSQDSMVSCSLPLSEAPSQMLRELK